MELEKDSEKTIGFLIIEIEKILRHEKGYICTYVHNIILKLLFKKIWQKRRNCVVTAWNFKTNRLLIPFINLSNLFSNFFFRKLLHILDLSVGRSLIKEEGL